jgi:branched-chain amino acid transport system ATP-binding protein
MLEVEGIEAGYGNVAILRGVALRVAQGELVCLVGANGAGKSTLMKTISGQLAPAKGRVVWLGRDLTRMPTSERVRWGLALVPEGRHIFPSLTVIQNLRLGTYAQRLSGSERQARIDLVLARFPRLAERRKQLAGTMSGGEQQMLAIGRALMSKPKLLLLDEPSLGLAPLIVAEVFELVRGLRDQGMAVLLVEQNAGCLAVADRAYVIENGRIKKEGTPDSLSVDADVKAIYLGI